MIFAAGVLKLASLAGPAGAHIHGQVLVGSLVAGTAAYASVRFLVRYFQTRTLTPFAISVVGVGALLLVFLPSARRATRPFLLTLGALWVLAIGFSRLGLGVHYLTDVLGGYLLGAGWLAVTTALFTAWRRDLARPPRPLTQGLEPSGPEPQAHHRQGPGP